MKITAYVTLGTCLEWDPRAKTLTLKKHNILSRKVLWATEVDGSFEATFRENGDLAMGRRTIVDTRTASIEVVGEGFHEIVEALRREEFAKVARIAIAVKQAALGYGRRQHEPAREDKAFRPMPAFPLTN
jgi:hypothetical protein